VVTNPLPKVLLGVTADISLRLMRGFPQYLVEHGWDVHVVSSPGPLLQDLSEIPGVTAHPLSMTREVSLVADLRSLVAWIRLLVRVRPDVISIGTPKAGLLGGLAGLFAGVPVRIYLLRGLRFETTSGLQRRILFAVERLSVAASHIVLAVSFSLRQRAIELSMVKPEKIVVLGAGSSNGVDVATFDRTNFTEEEIADLSERLGLLRGVPVIGFVGRLTADKGLHVLAEACSILTQNGVDHQLLIVGSVDGESGRASLDRLQNAGRPAVVTGHVSEPAIYYQLMDLLCLPTLREGFPNVILEAGASSLPSVTTDATGAVDSTIHEETGLIVPKGDSEALAASLKRLLTNKMETFKMGNNARDFVRANFQRADVWAILEKFFSEQSPITTSKQGN